ncbi:hypothetical protein ACIPF8_12400 [Collimonas sp. NPDC087041]|uniref:hypothetical protein n=1 Tax=Collimonas sp. NPDC087041 TaxID=3363960 RepID=UPI00380A9B05
MDSAIITQSFVNEVLRLLQNETCFKEESISFEIQDDYKFLLISISTDDFPEDESLSSFKNVGHLLHRFIPGRRGDYSWMVNFTKKGKVVNSYFGGDLDNPNSGL